MAMDFGPFPFDNNNCFHFSNTQNEQDTKKKIEDEARKSKEEFIQHFYVNYSDDLPPIWMLVEILTFGEISTFYEYYLNNKSRKQIAKSYGVTDSSVMSSWIRQLCIVRNVCAHHTRLWNKVISITPAFPSKLANPEFVPLFLTTRDTFDNYRRIYNVLIFIQYLLYKITGEKTEFLKEVKNLVTEHSISIQRMGFPNNSSLDDIIKTLEQ